MNILKFGNEGARLSLIQPVDEHDLESMGTELLLLRALTDKDFSLTAVKVDNWNNDLSPWKTLPIFGREGFGGGADAFLMELLALTEEPEKTYIIGGYSLAGLFALYAAYKTERFSGVAAASPSMWFPGFTDYMRAHEPSRGAVYLSLGDREEKARNHVMAAVGERIREAHALLEEGNVGCTLEWNEGGHFKDADRRTAKAFAWVMERV